MSLNADAPSWSPSASASAFVPGQSSQPQAQPAAVADEWDAEPQPAQPEPQAKPEPVPEPVKVVEQPKPKPEPVVESVTKAVAEVTVSAPEPTKKSKKNAREYKKHDERENCNVVFIGHVDAGKSTISGQILLSTGQIDERTIEKFEKEAKEKNRESWWIAYIMDTSEEERAKGKTVECGRANFETPTKRFTILDAPGHKNYVPNMIAGAAAADVGVLVVSTRKGEFEAGFDRGGQTREHAMLAKTLGISKLVVALNKMDTNEVWDKERYDEILSKLGPFLKQSGFNLKKAVEFIPISGLSGQNIKDPVGKKACPWYDGPPLLTLLDEMKGTKRDPDAPLRIPVMDKYKDMGCMVALGKVESGTLYQGKQLTIEPEGTVAEINSILVDEQEVSMAGPGENVCVFLKGVTNAQLRPGNVLCGMGVPCHNTKSFTAQMALLKLLEHKPILTGGYRAVLHIHTMSLECEITAITGQIDKKTGKKMKRTPAFVRSSAAIMCKIELDETVPLETFKTEPQLGRFTLRDEGKTIAVGKVTSIE